MLAKLQLATSTYWLRKSLHSLQGGAALVDCRAEGGAAVVECRAKSKKDAYTNFVPGELFGSFEGPTMLIERR